MNVPVYPDDNATTPVAPDLAEAMRPFQGDSPFARRGNYNVQSFS